MSTGHAQHSHQSVLAGSLRHLSHAMRNEHVEEVVADLVGENDAKPDAALMSGGRTNRRGSERGKK
jgi:hypothetical protein